MNKKLLTFYSLILLLCITLIQAESGTLVVEYEVTDPPELINRVRFWLRNDNFEQVLYPKSNHNLTNDDIEGKKVTITSLPEGTYYLKFLIPNRSGKFAQHFHKEITIQKNETTYVKQNFSTSQENQQPLHKTVIDHEYHKKIEKDIAPKIPEVKTVVHPVMIEIIPNIDDANWAFYQDGEKRYFGKGKEILSIMPGTNYKILADEINGEYPEIKLVKQFQNESSVYRVEITYPEEIIEESIEFTLPIHSLSKQPSKPVMQTVSDGPSILGDPFNDNKSNELPSMAVWIDSFSIGVFEVTNDQFSNWLNEAFQNHKLSFQKGDVLDSEGNLITKTFDSEPLSQIKATLIGNDPQFAPLQGKGNHPVIFVTWNGANAYCQDNNSRLPTEAEWEKAASVTAAASNGSIKKYRYGFSKNSIDPTWANYQSSNKTNEESKVKTREVGYYNGNNVLINDDSTSTNLATSPWGMFDMSGNVWEWVSDWYESSYPSEMTKFNPSGPKNGTLKVAKGGCYDSTTDGVRVAERIGLAADHADAYTGFRVAR